MFYKAMRVAGHSRALVPTLLTALPRLCLLPLELVAGLLRTRDFQVLRERVSSLSAKLTASDRQSETSAVPAREKPG